MVEADVATILGKLDAIETMIGQSSGRRIPDRSIMCWREAADVLGIQGSDIVRRGLAARKPIHMLAAKPNGPSLRLYRNGVHRGDFERWLESSGRPSMSDVIRKALAPRGSR